MIYSCDNIQRIRAIMPYFPGARVAVSGFVEDGATSTLYNVAANKCLLITWLSWHLKTLDGDAKEGIIDHTDSSNTRIAFIAFPGTPTTYFSNDSESIFPPLEIRETEKIRIYANNDARLRVSMYGVLLGV